MSTNDLIEDSISLSSASSNLNSKPTNCGPRNALFCCSTPVCLNLSNTPTILPPQQPFQQQKMDINNCNVANNNNNNNETSVKPVEHPQLASTASSATAAAVIPVLVPDITKINLTNTNGIVVNNCSSNDIKPQYVRIIDANDTLALSKSATAPNLTNTHDNGSIVSNGDDENNKPLPRSRRLRTPPQLGGKLGVTLKRVSPPKTHIQVKKPLENMLGVVLRRVEKKSLVSQKSILDDDKPLYHLSIVRGDNNSKEPAKPKGPPLKPGAAAVAAAVAAAKAKQASAAAANAAAGNNNALIRAKPQQPLPQINNQPRQVTIQKIEGDKIIIIKKMIIPKSSKFQPPAHYLQVNHFFLSFLYLLKDFLYGLLMLC